MAMKRGQFLQIAASVITFPLSLRVREDGERYTLASTYYRPAGKGPFPLAVLNHGAPIDYADAPAQVTTFNSQSRWFVNRGWAVLVPNRRGYGGSSGTLVEGTGPCSHPDFASAIGASADDILAATAAICKRPEIDSSRIVIGGVSAGGIGSLAAAARSPEGVVGVINFDGGRGSFGDGQNCDPDQLVALARKYGATTDAPALWLWAKNDHRFSVALGRRMYDAYESHRTNGDDRFIVLPPSGDDGHQLFMRADAVPLWSEHVASFLDRV
jgi:pimeloyl-ACP methyl ester carboxylesterase